MKEGKEQPVDKHQAQLAEFKSRISDLIKPHYTDHYLRKWLQARSFNVNRAEQMFRASMAYRQQIKADTLMNDYTPPEVLQKYLPGGFAGYDKEGSPIRLELYGYLDAKGILYSVKPIDIEKHQMLVGEQVMRKLAEQSRKMGTPVDGMTCIIDMQNVGTSLLWGPGMQMIAKMGEVLQDNYPEVVKRSYIVNAPRIFPLLWRMIRPLISEEMKRKVCILGSDYQRELLQEIDADQLPAFLGGTMTDPDGNPRCASRVCPGGIVPESYYLKDLHDTDHMQKFSLGRGDKVELKYDVTASGSLIRYEFKTDGFDVGFGVYYEGSEDKEDVVPKQRVNSHIVPEDGTVTCEKPGKYAVLFDNTYSWTRAKTIYYSIDVLPPEDNNLVEDLDAVTYGGSWGVVAQQSECTHF